MRHATCRQARASSSHAMKTRSGRCRRPLGEMATMAEIIITKHADAPIAQADRDAVRRVVFGAIDGLGEQNRKSWRRFWNRLLKLGQGELYTITTHQERLGWFHRKHMVMESRLFEAQERF